MVRSPDIRAGETIAVRREPAVKILLTVALTCIALSGADQSVSYHCPTGESFQVLLQKNGARAVVIVAGKRRLTLPKAGDQYSDGFTALTVKGSEASLASGLVNFKGCTDSTVKKVTQASLEGKWTLSTLANQPVLLPRPAFLQFQADGGVAGLTGCNRFNSGYTTSGSSLVFKGSAVTRMACIGSEMQVEDRFLRAIDQTRSYTIAGNTLTLRDSADLALATLTKN